MMMLHYSEHQNSVEQVRWTEDFCFLKGRGIIDSPQRCFDKSRVVIRVIISVNQLSVHEVISDWFEERGRQISDHLFSSTERPVVNMNDESESRTSTSCQS